MIGLGVTPKNGFNIPIQEYPEYREEKNSVSGVLQENFANAP